MTSLEVKNKFDKSNRILVVDDHPAIRNTMRDILTNEGFQADLASDGKIALNLCLRFDYDFVLTDLQMPEMNGVELLKALRQEKEKCPRFIFFSAYSTPELKDRAHFLGAYAFLKKPIKVEKILSLIRQKRNLSVLVHIKNNQLRNSTVTLLSENGYSVHETSLHDDALIKLRQIHYDCLILDEDSPGIEQETIERTIKTLDADTICLETNEDESQKQLLKKVNFHLDSEVRVLN